MSIIRNGLMAGAASMALAGTVSAYAEAEKPNFVIIMSDDAGYVDFGFMGSKEFKTPNLDKLAKNGVLFTHAYAGPTCSPSRSAMLTGRYQQRVGFGRNCGARFNEPNDGLPKGVQTLPMDLKKEGYTTGLVGKWHQGAVEGVNQPLDVGFDEFWGLLGGSRNYFGLAKGANAMWRGRTPDPQWVKRQSSIEPDPKKGRYITDAIGDETVDFINKHAGDKEPFFVFASFTSPHTPIQAKAQDLAQFPNMKGVRKKQAAMQLAEDRAVGRIIKAIEDGGIEDETYVVFLNDNGGSNHSGINGQLRDFKGSVYEGGVRVPMIIAGPGLEQGSKYEKMVTHMDFLPTFVKLAGGKVERDLDGVDIMPFVKKKVNGVPHKQLFFRHTGAGVAVRTGKWKLINPNNPGEHGKNKPGKWELYNLAEDPSEKNNLAAKLPHKVTELKKKIAAWEAGLPKNRWGRFGKQDRNYFDSFTYNPAKSNWFDQGAWSNTKEPSKDVRISCQDLYPNAELVFPTSKAGKGYTVNNDLYSASGLNSMVNKLKFDATEKVILQGNGVRLVKSLAGQEPTIEITGKAVTVVKTPLVSEGKLNVSGNGLLSLKGGLNAEEIVVSCGSFEVASKIEADRLVLSSKRNLIYKPVNIAGELVITPGTKLIVRGEAAKKLQGNVFKASKIAGRFENKTVKIGEKNYDIVQTENSISLKLAE